MTDQVVLVVEVLVIQVDFEPEELQHQDKEILGVVGLVLHHSMLAEVEVVPEDQEQMVNQVLE
jgi:hypothetical protein